MTADRADRVFRNGRVFRADAARSWADAVAIGGGRILAVGGWHDVAPLVTAETEVVDLDGRYLGPGFQDAHVHPLTGGRRLRTCDLTDAVDGADALRLVAAYAEAHPELPWIQGGGWQFSWFPGGMPGADLLDTIVPDRPVYLRVADGHAGWANSAALSRAGVDAATPEPRHGRIERLADGRPQGTVQEEGGMALLERVLPPESEEERREAMLLAQGHLLSLGITAWQDAAVDDRVHRAYLDLVASDALIATVRGASWWEPDGGIVQLERHRLRRREGVGRYQVTSVKLMLDGVCENFTARTLTPYLDAAGRPTGNRGMDYLDPGALPGIVAALVEHGFQPHLHALGDAAVRAGLDAVEHAWAVRGRRDLRPHLAHLQMIHPDDVPRFARLGVGANIQALWACADSAMVDLALPFLGEPRSTWQYPFGDLLRAGATLAMGSDWSVSSADPLAQLTVAVTRQHDGTAPFLPEQRITLADAMTAFTAGSAWVNHRDRVSGTIAPGLDADLVVLDGDPFGDAGPVGCRVEETIVAGATVFRR